MAKTETSNLMYNCRILQSFAAAWWDCCVTAQWWCSIISISINVLLHVVGDDCGRSLRWTSVVQISTEQHQKPWNVGRCPQRLHCYQMMAGWVSRWQFYWRRSMCFCGLWACWSENKLLVGFQWPVCMYVYVRTCTRYIVRTGTRLQNENIFRKESIIWLTSSQFRSSVER